MAWSDDSTVGADVSVSLGLIVTELAINALKHAIANQSTGTIVIDYRSSGKNWTLSVTDNGVGMATGSDARQNSKQPSHRRLGTILPLKRFSIDPRKQNACG